MSERSLRHSRSKRIEIRHRSRDRISRTRKARDCSRSWSSKESTPGRVATHRRSSASKNERNVRGSLRRTASEPNLWQGDLHWDDDDSEKEGKMKRKEKLLCRPQTLSDLFDGSYAISALPPRTPLASVFYKTELLQKGTNPQPPSIKSISHTHSMGVNLITADQLDFVSAALKGASNNSLKALSHNHRNMGVPLTVALGGSFLS